MIQTLRNAWKIPELRKKLIFTMFVLLLYRVGNVIPVPFIDVSTLTTYYDTNKISGSRCKLARVMVSAKKS